MLALPGYSILQGTRPRRHPPLSSSCSGHCRRLGRSWYRMPVIAVRPAGPCPPPDSGVFVQANPTRAWSNPPRPECYPAVGSRSSREWRFDRTGGLATHRAGHPRSQGGQFSPRPARNISSSPAARSRGRRADHGDQQTGDSAAAPGSSAGTSSKLSPETQPSGPDWLHEPSTMGASYRGFTSSASIRRRRSWRAFTFASAGAMTFSAILVSNVSNPSYRCGGSTQSYFQ